MRKALAFAALLGLTGCDQDFFHAKGAIASQGGRLGTWRTGPEGCTRDPFPGLESAHASTVLSFLWDDPSVRDPKRVQHRATAPDAPMRLEIANTAVGYTLKLDTVKTTGTRFYQSDCRTFAVETRETPKAIPEGRPTLSGTVRFDCQVEDSRVTADVRFERCEF